MLTVVEPEKKEPSAPKGNERATNLRHQLAALILVGTPWIEFVGMAEHCKDQKRVH